MTAETDRSKPDLKALRIDRDDDEHRRFPIARAATWIIVLAVLGVAGWFAYARFMAPRFYPEVEALTVRRSVQTTNLPTLSATGYLVADRRAEITPKISGRVIQLRFDVGDEVKRGQVLAVLESAQVEAQLREAQAAYADALREYNRQQALWKEEVTSRALLDAASAQLEVARARVDQVRVNVVDSTIAAPFDGTIIAKNTELGEVVSPMTVNVSSGTSSGGGSIASLADLRTIEVEADVNESNVGQLREGQPAEIAVDAFPGRKFRGRLRQVVPTADRAKGVVKVKVAFTDASARLLPDMSATVSFLQTERTAAELAEKPAIWIPESALIRQGTFTQVALITAEKTVELKGVQAGRAKDGRVEIVSGLDEGQTIVLRDAGALEDGQKIRTAEEG